MQNQRRITELIRINHKIHDFDCIDLRSGLTKVTNMYWIMYV